MYFFYKYGRFIFLRGYFSTHGAVDPWQQRVVYSPVFCIKVWTVPAPNKFGIETRPNSDNTTRCGRHSIVRDRGIVVVPGRGECTGKRGSQGNLVGRQAPACVQIAAAPKSLRAPTHTHPISKISQAFRFLTFFT